MGPGAASGGGTITSFRALSIGRGRASSVPLAQSDRSAADERRHNLPHPIASFVGREREVAEVTRLLATTRLLTLTGTGGVGKTRLGHEAAAGLLDAYPDGVWIVELAALADGALVPQAVAAVLGVRQEPGRPLTATLADALRAERLLLVLDNCEHLIDACAALAHALLRAGPEPRILATSRQALGIAGETTFWVPSLSLAAPLDAPTVSAPGEDEVPAPVAGTPPAQSDAVRLFVERARAVLPSFTLTDRNVSAVAEVCRRLDGIPLAIELAAARVPVLSPEQIAARLGDRFRLLTGGGPTTLPRYRTLRALVDWSHDLLDEGERTLLRRLAVFAGGWTLEAAEAVCAGEGLAPDEVLDLLSGLVAKSLVLADDHAGEVRYRFLETLREYAAERLRDAGEETILRERHRDWFLALAERAEPALEYAEEAGWFDRLDAERDNLRAVERWAAARGDAETVVRLGAALWQFWQMQADAADARERVDAILALAAATPLAPARAKALDGAGVLARMLGDYPAARALGEESLALARQLDDRRRVAVASYSLGRIAYLQGRYADGRALLEEALAAFRQLGHRTGVAAALNRLGYLAFSEGDLPDARPLLEQSLAVARETGYARLVGAVLFNLGLTAHFGGDLEAARRLYEEWRAINAARGDRHDLANALHMLGHATATQGDLPAARALYRESLIIAREVGNRRRLALVLWALATLAAAERDWERAVRLRASAEAWAEAMGVVPARPMRELWDAQLEPARRALGSQDIAAAGAAGRALTLEQAVDEALGWLAGPESSPHVGARPAREGPPPPVTGPAVPAAPAPPGGGGLTPRELEVAALVARGLSNRQIADELVIAEGTAANHVKHILARLTLDSRVQIAAWAIEHGLHRPSPS
jgi:predicted ATPase/DNA-binding CsgD family transcriptional regulator